MNTVSPTDASVLAIRKKSDEEKVEEVVKRLDRDPSLEEAFQDFWRDFKASPTSMHISKEQYERMLKAFEKPKKRKGKK